MWCRAGRRRLRGMWCCLRGACWARRRLAWRLVAGWRRCRCLRGRRWRLLLRAMSWWSWMSRWRPGRFGTRIAMRWRRWWRLLAALAGRLAIARDTLGELRAQRCGGSRGGPAAAFGWRFDGQVRSGGSRCCESFGAEFFFTGALIQPGKPVVFGRLPKRGQFQVNEAGEYRVPFERPWDGDGLIFLGCREIRCRRRFALLCLWLRCCARWRGERRLRRCLWRLGWRRR